MTNTIGIVSLLVMAGVLSAITVCQPGWISDSNIFLKGFVNHEFLNILGVIVAITAASAANIHLELRRLEKEYEQPNAFQRTREEVRSGSYVLVALFLAGFALVIAKPGMSISEYWEAAFNGGAVFIVFFNVIVLVGILQLSFKVGPIDI